MTDISGVILAGGANTRLGGWTKARIRVGGKMIITRMLETISTVFEEIIIVTNTPEEFSDLNNIRITRDEYTGAGPLAGIHAAMKASGKESCFVFAGDMPLIDKNLILKQIEFYRSIDHEIVIPRCGNFIEPLHSIYRNAMIHDLEQFLKKDGKKAVRDFIKSRNISYFPAKEDSEAFININSPADILRAERILAGMKK